MKTAATLILISIIVFGTLALNIPRGKALLQEDATVNVLASTGGTTDPPAGINTYFVEWIFAHDLQLTADPDNGFRFLYWEINGNITLKGNPAIITIGNGGYGFNCTVQAVFQRIPPPKISILTPQNQRYNQSNVPIVYSANEVVNWTGYSLDGKQNITITGNGTLSRLSSGSHNIVIYANDSYGNMGASESVSFTIAKPFPILTVAAISVTIAMVVGVAGLLIYFRKRKR